MNELRKYRVSLYAIEAGECRVEEIEAAYFAAHEGALGFYDLPMGFALGS